MAKFLLTAFVCFVTGLGSANAMSVVELTPEQMAHQAVIQATIDAEPVASYETLADLLSPEELAAELDQAGLVEESDSSYFSNSAARLKIFVDKAKEGTSPTAQTINVYLDGQLVWTWSVSTGRETPELAKSGKRYFSRTPTGTFRITRMSKNHFSNTWKAPMPYAMFFVGGIAIHATGEQYYSKLGTRASGGCVRIKHENAAALWNLVNEVGVKNVLITVYDSSRVDR